MVDQAGSRASHCPTQISVNALVFFNILNWNTVLLVHGPQILPCDAMLYVSTVIAISRCHSVHLSVRLSHLHIVLI